MPTDQHDPLALLRRLATEAAARAAAKRAPRQYRAAQAIARIARQRDAHLAVVQAVPAHDPRGWRADALAYCYRWRILAWMALSNGDADTALACCISASRALRAARQVAA